MVLSFMVVWDLPAISKGISSLRSSRLSAIYNEVAPSLSVFGMLFGKALQAQVSMSDVLKGNVIVMRALIMDDVLVRCQKSALPTPSGCATVSAGVTHLSIRPCVTASQDKTGPVMCVGADRNGEYHLDSSGDVGASNSRPGPPVTLCLHMLLYPHCWLLHLHHPSRLCGPHRIRLPEGEFLDQPSNNCAAYGCIPG